MQAIESKLRQTRLQHHSESRESRHEIAGTMLRGLVFSLVRVLWRVVFGLEMSDLRDCGAEKDDLKFRTLKLFITICPMALWESSATSRKRQLTLLSTLASMYCVSAILNLLSQVLARVVVE
jgi:hypothetical protein